MEKVTLYQLAPEELSLTMCYVIKTKHNKLIVIDGGIDGHGINNPAYLPSALRAVSGVGEGGYFEVEAWFLTHAHSDHMRELSKCLKSYSEKSGYKIKNIYFDFPPFGTAEFSGTSECMSATGIRENMNEYGKAIGAEVGAGGDYYDTVNGAVINKEAIKNGLEFNIDGVRIEILQTWDIADGYSNLNDQSLIFRIWVDGQSVLFLGDAGEIAGKRLIATYGDKIKSDIVQMAHHGQNGVDRECYAQIDAQMHLWPTPVWVWANENKFYQTDATREWLYGENFLESDEYNIVAGLYKEYPTSPDITDAWTDRVLDNMKIELPYILPHRNGNLNK